MIVGWTEGNALDKSIAKRCEKGVGQGQKFKSKVCGLKKEFLASWKLIVFVLSLVILMSSYVAIKNSTFVFTQDS